MKRRYRAIIVCMIFLMFTASLGCRTVLYTDAAAADRVFTISGDTMSDGKTTYKPLPKNWRYYGDYPYQIGSVKDGKALYASDETGMIVKEKKPLFADMDYISRVREDIDLEHMSEKDYCIVVDNARSGELVLSEQAKAEVLDWYRAYQNRRNESDTAYHGKTGSKMYFAHPALHDLRYKSEFLLASDADAIYVVDLDGHALGTFRTDTAFFREFTGQN